MTRMVAGTLRSEATRMGSMERVKSITKVAGVDVGKRRLDVAVHGQAEQLQVANDLAGRAHLAAWLQGHAVTRVGLEATGGYEQAVRSDLEAAGLEVVIH